jgi:hypothetical protein
VALEMDDGCIHTAIFRVTWETHARRSDGQVDPVAKDKGDLVFEVAGNGRDDVVKKVNEFISEIKNKYGNSSTVEKSGFGKAQVRWLGGTQPQHPALLAVRETPAGRDGDGTED